MENGRVRFNMIKWLVFVIIILASFFCDGQTKPQYFGLKGDMSVLETTILSEKICYERTKVIWVVKHDTMYFAFSNTIIKLYPVSKENNKVRHRKEKIRKAIESVEKHNRIKEVESIWYILQDRRGELYWVAYNGPDRYNPNFSFFISSIEYGLPNYLIVFDKHVNLCN